MGGELGSGQDGFVVVPHVPGPLVRRDPRSSQREHDELDELIDDLFPDTDEAAGWFDAGLVLVGAGLVVWGALAGGPTLALVAGVVAVGLGCILPLRAVGRRIGGRAEARRRAALLAQGTPLRTTDPSIVRLVAAYDRLVAVSAQPTALAAAHEALLEVASLLRGRAATSSEEQRYVDDRSGAIEELVAALEAAPTEDETDRLGVDQRSVVEARDEVDQLSGTSTLGRLAELTEQARAGDERPG